MLSFLNSLYHYLLLEDFLFVFIFLTPLIIDRFLFILTTMQIATDIITRILLKEEKEDVFLTSFSTKC